MFGKWQFTLALALFSSVANADLVVNRSIVMYDDPKAVKEDVVVLNSDEIDNLYVQVDTFRVANPGSEEEELVKLIPGSTPEFLVSPNKLVVPPSGRSLVRLLDIEGDRSEERVYRVNLVPVTPPVELQEDGENSIASRLEVVVAYQVLTIVLPEDPKPELEFVRSGSLASFSNTGNANYLLTDGEQCNPGDPDDCQRLENRRIYPGNEWLLELPFEGPFTYTVKTHAGMSARQFN